MKDERLPTCEGEWCERMPDGTWRHHPVITWREEYDRVHRRHYREMVSMRHGADGLKSPCQPGVWRKSPMIGAKEVIETLVHNDAIVCDVLMAAKRESWSTIQFLEAILTRLENSTEVPR